MSKSEVATYLDLSLLDAATKARNFAHERQASWQQIGKALSDLYNRKIFIDDRSAISAVRFTPVPSAAAAAFIRSGNC